MLGAFHELAKEKNNKDLFGHVMTFAHRRATEQPGGFGKYDASEVVIGKGREAVVAPISAKRSKLYKLIGLYLLIGLILAIVCNILPYLIWPALPFLNK